MDKETRLFKSLAKRIVEIFNNYGGEMPSVAILVGDDVDISEMIQVMTEQDILNGIKTEKIILCLLLTLVFHLMY